MNIQLFLKQYLKMFSQQILLPLVYKKACRQKVEKGLVLFADAHHDSRPDNMELLYQRLTDKEGKKKYKVEEIYLDYQRNSPKKVLRSMICFMKRYASAEYVILCDNFLPVASCKKRKETKVIQLWHACGAYKRFGYDTTDDIPSNYHGNVFNNTDLVTVSADFAVRPFASAMRLPETHVKPLGVSRTDRYFDENWKKEARELFFAKYPQAKGKKVLLWAPTFRGNPGQPQLPQLDLKKLQAELGEEWLVLCKVHPHMRKKFRGIDCEIPTEQLFEVTDVLIADFSSLIYEYLLFKKPLVLYIPDLKEYKEKRGFYMDPEKVPAVRIEREEELAAGVLRACETSFSSAESFNHDYMGGCDGHATERIVGWMSKNCAR